MSRTSRRHHPQAIGVYEGGVSHREAELRQGFERITVAAAGSIVAAELEELGVQVNVKPQGDTFFMKPLVRELAVALTK